MSNSLVVSNTIELLGGGQLSQAGLATGVTYHLGQSWDGGAPQPVVDISGDMILDGERPYGRRAANRTITLPITIVAPQTLANPKMSLAAARELLLQLIDQPTWTLTWIRDQGQLPVMFDCFRAKPAVNSYALPEQNALVSRLTITFDALPYGRSDIQTQVAFASPLSIPGQPSAPPPPIVIDNYSTVSGPNWAASSICVIGPQTAMWDPNLTGHPDGDGVLMTYTKPLGSVSLAGYTALTFWLGMGARNWWELEHQGRTKMSVTFTLTDVSGNMISFATHLKVPVANSLTAPAWTPVSVAIPQGLAPFSYGAVASYKVVITNKGNKSETRHVVGWLDNLTANPPSRVTVAASVRGWPYVIAGVQGSVHTPMSAQVGQPGGGQFSTMLLHRPGPGAPPLLMPFIGVGNGNDTPSGLIEYPVPSLASPVPLNSNSQFTTVVTPWVAYNSGAVTWSNSVWPAVAAAVIVNTSGGVSFLSGNASTFEGGNANWVPGTNCSIANSTAQAHGGTHSLALTSTAAGSMDAASCAAGSILTQGMACAAGDTITASAWFRAAVSSRSVNVGIDFYDNTGTHIGSTLRGSNVSDTTSGWTQATASVTAPIGASFCRADPQVVSTGAASEVHYIDDVLMADTSNPGMRAELDAVVGGNWYQASAVMFSPQGWSTCQIGISWYDNTSTFISSFYSSQVNCAAGNLAGQSATTGAVQAPPNAAYGQMFVQLTGNPASTIQLAVDNATFSNAALPARLAGSYSALLSAASWHNPAVARNVSVTIRQYSFPGGQSWSQTVGPTSVTPAAGTGGGSGAPTGFIQRMGTGKLSSSSGTSFSATMTKASVAGNSILVKIGYGINPGSSVTSVGPDSKGNAYTLIYAANTTTTGGRGAELWACLNPANTLASGDTVPIVMSASQSNGAGAIVDEYQPLTAPTTEKGTDYNSSPSTSVSPQATMLAGDSIAVSLAVVMSAGDVPKIKGPFTSTGSDVSVSAGGGNGLDMNAGYLTPTSAGSLTGQWTWSGEDHTNVGIIVGFPGGAGSSGGGVNPFALIGEVTLPIRDIPPDNTLAYYTVLITSSDPADRFLDLLMIDTSGQTIFVNETTGSGYANYYVDEPDADHLIGRVMASQVSRADAASVLPETILSGGVITAEPGDNLLLAYCIEGAPQIALSYYPRWFFDRLY